MDEHDDNTLYRVVVNDEEQYSIWPLERDLPAGWHDAGKEGRKDEVLGYINEHWTDMRPLSLRKQMAAASRRADAQGGRAGSDAERPPDA
jgi:MbtH protein